MDSIIRLSCVINRVSTANPRECLREIAQILETVPESDITVLPKLALCSPSGGGLLAMPQLCEECAAAIDELQEICAERTGYIIVGLAVADLGQIGRAHV